MSQKITITIDGKDGIVRPDLALRILEQVFRTLESIDANTWAVGVRRLQWRVAKASVKNPFALTYSGSIKGDYSSPPDVSELFIRGCDAIEKGQRAKYFTDDDYKRMNDVGKAAKHLRSLQFKNTVIEHKVSGSKLADNAADFLDNPTRVMSHGSLEGTLVTLQNYPDKKSAGAMLQTRASDEKVYCSLTPTQAEELNDYVDRKSRVIVYGRITFDNNTPKNISVERYTVIPPDDQLPTLADVRALGLTMPGKMSIEDFISETRGDD